MTTCRKVVDDIFHIEEGAVGMVNDVSMNALVEINRYLAEQFEDRKRHPRDDMFTDLLHAEIVDDDGTTRRLSDSELTEFVTVLFSAGTETVARHLGWSVDLLDRHPDQRAELAADPTLVANAVEESLRYEPPSPVNARFTTRDVTLHDVTIPAGSKVVLVTGAAGRDERMYPDPDTFDVHRDVDLHMTLGYGIHFCLGAALGAHGGSHRGGGDAEAVAGLHGRPRARGAALHEHRARVPRTAVRARRRLIRRRRSDQPRSSIVPGRAPVAPPSSHVGSPATIVARYPPGVRP